MKEQIADICRKVNDSIRNFRVDPINSLEYLIPIVIFLIGIINGVVTQYAFAHNGGVWGTDGCHKNIWRI